MIREAVGKWLLGRGFMADEEYEGWWRFKDRTNTGEIFNYGFKFRRSNGSSGEDVLFVLYGDPDFFDKLRGWFGCE